MWTASRARAKAAGTTGAIAPGDGYSVSRAVWTYDHASYMPNSTHGAELRELQAYLNDTEGIYQFNL
jgi:hypothetical protein